MTCLAEQRVLARRANTIVEETGVDVGWDWKISRKAVCRRIRRVKLSKCPQMEKIERRMDQYFPTVLMDVDFIFAKCRPKVALSPRDL